MDKPEEEFPKPTPKDWGITKLQRDRSLKYFRSAKGRRLCAQSNRDKMEVPITLPAAPWE